MPAQINIFDEITVDGFCGGGGWSTGFELAIGEPVTIGINHDAAAISMHKANHPATQHYNENIFLVDPKQAVATAVLCCTVFYGVVIAVAEVVFSIAVLVGGAPC